MDQQSTVRLARQSKTYARLLGNALMIAPQAILLSHILSIYESPVLFDLVIAFYRVTAVVASVFALAITIVYCFCAVFVRECVPMAVTLVYEHVKEARRPLSKQVLEAARPVLNVTLLQLSGQRFLGNYLLGLWLFHLVVVSCLLPRWLLHRLAGMGITK